MTGIIVVAFMILAARIAYLEYINRDLRQETYEYKSLVMEWYNYLSDKKYGDDFRLWKQEMENE